MKSESKSLLKSLLFIICLCLPAGAQTEMTAQIPLPDRIRLAEAFRLAETLGDEVWKGWSQAPFAVVLVTHKYEFLMRHPNPPKDFTELGSDPLLKSKIYYRERVFNPEFLATMYVGGVPTIVIGQAENTDAKTSTRWVVTLMHEHFHQLQYSQPDYQAGVSALNLARGDQTGMWMLNYAFPYSDAEVNKRFQAMVEALASALESRKTPQFSSKLAAYFEARKQFEKSLAPDDYKYFSFQLWQEGLARYTEYRIAQLAAKKYKPSAEFAQMKDFSSFDEDATATLNRVLSRLPKLSLDKSQRTTFYTVGAAEALLLDEANPDWQRRYLAEKFYPEKYFAK